ncbi:winged helix-turn-helix domain-containing protein [Brevirhabdus sp.]|uniref:winged helix-turn-helix domain-containing protein n=1 Tax=Brevirhabdus sp. TaxID=2004514 RepID=UPI00405820E1
MSRRPPYSLVVERDTALRARCCDALRAMGGGRVLRRARASDVGDLVSAEATLGALLVGLLGSAARDEDMLALIALTRRRLPDALILAVDPGTRPLGPAEAFAAGADDVLHSNGHPSEFDARLALRLRQARPATPRTAYLSRMALTPAEAAILQCLGARPGEIVSRSALAQEIGEADWSYGDRRFDVHIARIRRKLRDHYGEKIRVRTIRAQGYLLESDFPLAR